MITSQPTENNSLFTLLSEYMELETMSVSLMGVSLGDNGGRRTGINRRIYSYTDHVPERRNGLERRCGMDRRSGQERRTSSDRRTNFDGEKTEVKHNLEPP